MLAASPLLLVFLFLVMFIYLDQALENIRRRMGPTNRNDPRNPQRVQPLPRQRQPVPISQLYHPRNIEIPQRPERVEIYVQTETIVEYSRPYKKKTRAR